MKFKLDVFVRFKAWKPIHLPCEEICEQYLNTYNFIFISITIAIINTVVSATVTGRLRAIVGNISCFAVFHDHAITKCICLTIYCEWC